jgi:biopolymer transport protein ExbD
MRRRKLYFTRLPKATTGEMNMTPLIDVLLVLIVMLILTVPVMTHTTQIDLPRPAPARLAIADRNAVTIDAQDRLYWNGQPVTRETLGAQLVAAAARPDAPEVRFEPAATASYDRSAKTIALIKDSGVEKFGFVGNEQYGTFGK